MKIAILTQPLGHNYGGIMQAYALQRFLRDLGHDVTTIDRQPDKKNVMIRLLLPFKPVIKPVIYKFLGRKNNKKLSSKQNKYIYSNMTNFINKHINLSEPISSTATLKSHYKKNHYDLVIVGSDQVWRPRYSPSIYNFFVDFIDNGDRSISYAASFGVDDWEFSKEQTEHCKKLIQKFDAVSVREKSAIALCKNNLDMYAELVLDPTLLIKAEDYKKLLSSQKSKGKGKGKVLKYILDDSAPKKQVISEVAEKLGTSIFSAQPTRNILDTNYDNLDDYKYPAIEEWIMSFYDAEFVVTDSFHGCIFSIIFNKPFIAIGNSGRGLARFYSLLSIFELTDRLILDDDKKFLELIEKEIDWERVETKLRFYQEISNKFLRSNGVM